MKKTGFVFCAAIVLCSTGFGSIERASAQQQKRDEQGRTLERDSERPDVWYPILSAEEAKERRDKINALRAKWRGWAQRHREPLQKMLSAKATDQAAMWEVYDAVPSTPTIADAGFTSRDLVTIEDINQDRIFFTWNCPLDAGKGTNAETRERLRAWKVRHEAQLQRDFAEMRDIVITSSVNIGPTRLSLWASGRVTESRLELGAGFRQPVWKPRPTYQEVLPPYEFLKSQPTPQELQQGPHAQPPANSLETIFLKTLDIRRWLQ